MHALESSNTLIEKPVARKTSFFRAHNKSIILGTGVFALLAILTVSLSVTLRPREKTIPDYNSTAVIYPTNLNTSAIGMKSLSADDSDLVLATNNFGTRLLSQLAAASNADAMDALFISPWGISHALGMVHEGTVEGSGARQQLQHAVYGAAPDQEYSNDSLRAALHDLSTQIITSQTQNNNDNGTNDNNNNITVSDANSAWIAPRFPISQPYTQALEQFYLAYVAPLTSAQNVNDWVSNATHDKITTIIDDSIAQMASLVLVNAIYFKGNWLEPFSPKDTKKAPFTLMNGSSMEVPMMFKKFDKTGNASAAQVATFQAKLPGNSGTTTNCTAVKLSYKSGLYSAIFSMPTMDITAETSGEYAAALSACREAMTGGASAVQWMSINGLDLDVIKLYLPRFEVTFESSLNGALRQLGVTDIFSPGNLQGITGGNAVISDLAVSDVVHKVYVKNDEQGTEAAAVTGIVFLTSMPLAPPKEIVVRFDKPFSMAIVHESTGLALFNGELYRPEQWSGA